MDARLIPAMGPGPRLSDGTVETRADAEAELDADAEAELDADAEAELDAEIDAVELGDTLCVLLEVLDG
jgi:hypothetical protein